MLSFIVGFVIWVVMTSEVSYLCYLIGQYRGENKKIKREDFIKQEAMKGRIMVIWQDIDAKVYGWDLSADNEVALLGVIGKIAEAKESKLRKTVGNLKGG